MDNKEARQFLDFCILHVEKLHDPNPEKVNVTDFRHPAELQQLIDFNLDTPCSKAHKLIKLVQEIVNYSVKTNHVGFYNQLYGGCDLYGISASLLAESLNTNMHTFEAAPVFTLVEKAVIQHVKKIIGYESGDGIFTPGGSISNMYAMVLARYKKYPKIKETGLSNLPPLVAYTSEDGHYSLEKAASWLGIGLNNIKKIKTNRLGQMDVDHLYDQIKTTLAVGKRPFFVNATYGTTVLGAFDPLEDIAKICEECDLWLHVDACFGGSLMLAKIYEDHFIPVAKADSYAWNPHKMLGAPLQCSLIVTRHNEILEQCNSASANYLFQHDKFYDSSYDTGDKSIQCGRKVDAFKLWIMWKARGADGFDQLVLDAMDNCQYFWRKISKLPNFRLVLEEFQCAAVCFWFIPDRLLHKEENAKWWDEINKLAPRLKERLIKDSSIMISYMRLKSKSYANFWRLVVTAHPLRTHENMDAIVDAFLKCKNL